MPPHSEQARWFSEHVQPHEGKLRRWLGARFPSLVDRDDLVQESFVRVLRSHETTPIVNVRAFLFVTARNLALNHLRRRRHERTDRLVEVDFTTIPDERPNAHEAAARGQELGILQQALAELPDRCREVFVLRRLKGCSQREVAERLGISEKTVENHTALALAKCAEFFRRLKAREKHASWSLRGAGQSNQGESHGR